MIRSLLLVMVCCSICVAYRDWIEEPGPRVKATQGEVWPKPQQQRSTNEVMVVRPSVFLFVNEGTACKDLDEMLVRYKGIMLRTLPMTSRHCNGNRKLCPGRRRSSRSYLNSLRINLEGPCDLPLDSNMNETCK
ncbi:uncharacterized protein LOC113366875 [Ctenocephalides felis]|uniref:uncharacterized protein LOC113366875 n=1 Tax=Ctenocephalides felis TaxID=7515 RepID=UPI000E6E3B88|nr:uncharacterized protein LOC113366875 [Ctenocephalides felis]